MKKLGILIIGILLYNCGNLFSQKGDELQPIKSKTNTIQTVFNITISISPIHLAMPVVELMGEFAIKPEMGVAVIGGLGSYHDFSVFEIGGQLNLYLIGDFDQGMQGGIELLYASVSGSIEEVSGIGQGLSVGPYLGYKGAFSFGLSIDFQFGIAVIIPTAEDNSSSTSDKGLYPFLNFNVGWSF